MIPNVTPELEKSKGFPDGLDGKESACNASYPGSIPGSGRSPGGGSVMVLGNRNTILY